MDLICSGGKYWKIKMVMSNFCKKLKHTNIRSGVFILLGFDSFENFSMFRGDRKTFILVTFL